MTAPADLLRAVAVPGRLRVVLREMDARARAIVFREVAFPKVSKAPVSPGALRVIRGASRERMRIRHALRALESPARALAVLRVV